MAGASTDVARAMPGTSTSTTGDGALSLTGSDAPLPPPRLPFPPLTTAHVLACSYTAWYPIFRQHTPKARLVPLPAPFLAYLRADGIMLPASPQAGTPRADADDDEGFFSSSAVSDTSSDEEEDDDDDVSAAWPEVHAAVAAAIAELGGRVVPKLNWSAPKDAAWIGATNSMDCSGANDVYLLLKSSDFVSFDLECVFDGCVDWDGAGAGGDAPGRQRTKTERLDAAIPYALVLRKRFELNPSLEFRVFVRAHRVLGFTQRDMNHYDFLTSLRPGLKALIMDFWRATVRDNERWRKMLGGEGNYVMDVYVPPPHDRVWIVDFAPWDRRTDPGLWSWGELLSMDDPEEEAGLESRGAGLELWQAAQPGALSDASSGDDDDDDDGEEDADETYHDTPGPEFRLVSRDDPEAYMFNSTRYSAHKLPRDVVDASTAGEGGLREFADRWKEIVAREEAGRGNWRRGGGAGSGDDDDDD